MTAPEYGYMRVAELEVDFGPTEMTIARANVPARWVRPYTVISVAPAGYGNDDHDPEDAALEGITAYVANRVDRESFDVIAHAPNGTWGRYQLLAIGFI